LSRWVGGQTRSRRCCRSRIKGRSHTEAYWLSKAKLGAGKAKEALVDIDRALNGLSSSDRYWSTFKAHRYDVLVTLSIPDAIKDLREAVSACLSGRYKVVLEGRLAEAEAEASRLKGLTAQD
jgi:hypothetical protein